MSVKNTVLEQMRTFIFFLVPLSYYDFEILKKFKVRGRIAKKIMKNYKIGFPYKHAVYKSHVILRYS